MFWINIGDRYWKIVYLNQNGTNLPIFNLGKINCVEMFITKRKLKISCSDRYCNVGEEHIGRQNKGRYQIHRNQNRNLGILRIPRLEISSCAERPIEVPIVDRHCKQVGWSSKILKYKGRCKRFSQLVQVIVVSPSVKGHLHPIEFLLLVFLLRWISKVEDETFTALHWAFFFFFPLQE